MKTLRNKIAKSLNQLSDIRESLFFQSLSQSEKQNLYAAKELLFQLHTIVNNKIK